MTELHVGNQTLADALANLPDTLTEPVTIHVNAGVYPEPIDISRFRGTSRTPLKIIGGTFTGTVNFTSPYDGTTVTTVAYLYGPIHVELEQVILQGSGHTRGLWVESATVTLDRTHIRSTAGRFSRGIEARRSHLLLEGENIVRDFTGFGFALWTGSSAILNGTLTVTGPGTTSTGIVVAYTSTFTSFKTGGHITVRDVRFGVYVAINGSFQHHGPSSTLTFNNATKPAGSEAVHSGEGGTFSAVGNQMVINNFTEAFHTEFVGFLEHVGPRTLTNVSVTRVQRDTSYINLA